MISKLRKKNQKILVLVVCSLLVGSMRTEDDNYCKNLVKLNQYKSKVILTYHEREIHIEEYRIGRKGKLIVTENDQIQEVYYENLESETSVVLYNKTATDCVQEYLKNDEVILPYRFFNAKSGILGPTGLWSLVEDQFDRFKLTRNERDERGMGTHVCEARIYLREDVYTRVELFLSESHWKIFNQKNNPQLVGINIFSDRSFEDDDSLLLKVKIKYLTFEKIDDSENESLIFDSNGLEMNENNWQVPVVCTKMHRVIPEIEISKQFKMTLHKFDELTGSEQFKMNLVYDEPNDIMSLEKTKNYSTATKVFNLRKQFYLESNGNQCVYYAHANFELEDNEVIELVQQFFRLKDNYFDYMGNKVIRNIGTDVYVRNSTISTDERKGYFSVCVQRDDIGLAHPVQVLNQIFMKRDEKWQLTQSSVYNIYDFQPLDNDEQVNAMNIANCNQGETEFKLVARNDFKEPMDHQDEIDLATSLRRLLANKTAENIHNFPIVEVSIKPKEIISRVEFVDLDNPLNYFAFVHKANLLIGKRNESNTISTDKQTIEECAIESLKNENSIGFQFCNFKYCHILTDEKNGKLTVIESDEQCRTERKSVDNNIAFKYEAFDKKLKKLLHLSQKGQLKLRHLDHDFVFNKIHFNKQEPEIDRSQLYELEAKGESISIYSTKRSLDVRSVADCYSACSNSKNNFTCDTFAFCNTENYAKECKLASWMDRDETDDEMFVSESVCDRYKISALKHFRSYVDQQLIDGDDTIIHIYDKAPNDCSQMCLNHNAQIKDQNKRCSSIEVCKNNSGESQIPLGISSASAPDDFRIVCRLSETHTLWDQRALKPKRVCNVYSVKHILNFHQTSQTLLENFMKKSVDSLDACATVCDISNDCYRFNYCESESGNTCHYVRENQTGAERIELESDLFSCVTFVHRNKLMGAFEPNQIRVQKNDAIQLSGFTIGELLKFMFTSLCFGGLVGSMIMANRWHKIKPKDSPIRTSFMYPDSDSDDCEEDSQL